MIPKFVHNTVPLTLFFLVHLEHSWDRNYKSGLNRFPFRSNQRWWRRRNGRFLMGTIKGGFGGIKTLSKPLNLLNIFNIWQVNSCVRTVWYRGSWERSNTHKHTKLTEFEKLHGGDGVALVLWMGDYVSEWCTRKGYADGPSSWVGCTHLMGVIHLWLANRSVEPLPKIWTRSIQIRPNLAATRGSTYRGLIGLEMLTPITHKFVSLCAACLAWCFPKQPVSNEEANEFCGTTRRWNDSSGPRMWTRRGMEPTRVQLVFWLILWKRELDS